MAQAAPQPGNPAQMNPMQAEPLAQLRDIHLPAPIEFWPPAPGWITLALIAAIAVIVALVWLYRNWRRDQYRREGLAALNALRDQYEHEADRKAYLENCANLLKRVALTRYPRTEVASLTGEAWVQFLDRTARTHEFSIGAGQALVQGCYEPDPNVEVDELHRLARYWIKQHGNLPDKKHEEAA